MRIYVFSDGVRHGCFVYREEIPLEALERRGHTVVGGLPPNAQLTAQLPEGGCAMDCDLFVFPRLAALDYPLVVDEIQRAGKPLVYEMDDAADLFERFHTSYYQVKNLLPSYYFFLHQANLVTTTTDHLAAHFRMLGAKHVVVLPNCPAPSAWAPARPRRPGPLRIGYTGWTAHILEAAYWMEIMAALRQVRQDFVSVLFGISNTSDTGPQWMEKTKAAVLQNPAPNQDFGASLSHFRQAYARVRPYLEWHSMTPVDDYATTLADLHLDIGCAVLHDTPFNRCKSCIKFYDYAQAGCVTIASDVLPYSTEPMLTVPNTVDAWVRMLCLLMDNAHHRQQRLDEQRTWIQAHRNPETWAGVREDAYAALLAPQLAVVG